MEKNCISAIIIIRQCTGNGKGIETAKNFKKHSLLASIKMSLDLFEPSATVQNIYLCIQNSYTS